MARKLRTATYRELTAIRVAIAREKDARDALRRAGALKAARAVSRALKSAEGALRHAERAADRGYRTGDGRSFATYEDATEHANTVARRTGAIVAVERR